MSVQSNVTAINPNARLFINAVFHDLRPDEAPCLVINPKGAPDKWGVRSIEQLSKMDLSSQGVYFQISATAKDNKGRGRRGRQNFKALCCVVLDDIGTKVKPPELKPSWIMETSPKNYQYGYILEEPIRDVAMAAQFVKQVYKDSSRTDTGGANYIRLMRLNMGVNHKEGKNNFKVRLKLLDAKVRYTVEQLIIAWGLDGAAIQGAGEFGVNQAQYTGAKDEFFEYLDLMGLVGPVKPSGICALDCPRKHEHSVTEENGGGDPGGYKLLGAGSNPGIRDFVCLHDHAESGKPKFSEWVNYYHDQYGAPKVGRTAEGADDLFDFIGKDEGLDSGGPDEDGDEEDGDDLILGAGKDKKHLPWFRLPDLDRTKEGDPKQAAHTLKNWQAFIEYYGIKIKFDIIRKEGEITGIPGDITDMSMPDTKTTMIWSLAQKIGWKISRQTVDFFIDATMAKSKYNPVTDWLESLPLPTDGVDYVDILTDTVKIDRSTTCPRLTKAIIRMWLLQCVAAADGAKRSGCPEALPKYESILVLSGVQGAKKTSWLQSLVPPQLMDTMQTGVVLEIKNKDTVVESTSGWIIELGEIDCSIRRNDISHLKAFLSKTTDRIRVVYARRHQTLPRQTSFCGSVNDEHFLHDQTGNRRFLPVAVESLEPIPLELLEKAMAQLFKAYLDGEKWWPSTEWMTEGLARLTAESHVDEVHPWIDQILEVYGEDVFRFQKPDFSQGQFVRLNDIANNCSFVLRGVGDSKKLGGLIKRQWTPAQTKKLVKKKETGFFYFMPFTNAELETRKTEKQSPIDEMFNDESLEDFLS